MTNALWALIDIVFTITETGMTTIVTTNVPCHLWMRWSLNPPLIHSTAILTRGLRTRDDVRFCFTVFHDNEQSEVGDTLIHTFVKDPWAVCETRYFYFHGTIAGLPSPSTTAIFKFHRPYNQFIATFNPDPWPGVTSCDGIAARTEIYGTWSSVHDAPGTSGTSNTTSVVIRLRTGPNPGEWHEIYRPIITFNTISIPLSATFILATLKVYGSGKIDELAINPTYNVYSATPNSDTDIIASDYQQVGKTPLATPINYTNWLNGSFNSFILNAAGLATITKEGITRFCIREATYDAPDKTPSWSSFKRSEVGFAQSESAEARWTILEVIYQTP